MKVTTNAVRCEKRETVWEEATDQNVTNTIFAVMFYGESNAKLVKALTALAGGYWLTIADGPVRKDSRKAKQVEPPKAKRGRPKTSSPAREQPKEGPYLKGIMEHGKDPDAMADAALAHAQDLLAHSTICEWCGYNAETTGSLMGHQAMCPRRPK